MAAIFDDTALMSSTFNQTDVDDFEGSQESPSDFIGAMNDEAAGFYDNKEDFQLGYQFSMNPNDENVDFDGQFLNAEDVSEVNENVHEEIAVGVASKEFVVGISRPRAFWGKLKGMGIFISLISAVIGASLYSLWSWMLGVPGFNWSSSFFVFACSLGLWVEVLIAFRSIINEHETTSPAS